MATFSVGIAGVDGVLRVHVVPGGALLLLSKDFFKDLGCHIDLGRGYPVLREDGSASCGDKQIVAAFAHIPDKFRSAGDTRSQLPHNRPNEYEIYCATCDNSKQDKIHLWIASTSERRTPETDSIDTEYHNGTDGQEQNPCAEARSFWEKRKARWVRVHGIARRTLLDPMQQREMTIHDTWPQTGEMRSLWKGTPDFWTRDMPQDDIWERSRHRSNMILLFRNHLTRKAVAMPPSLVNTAAQADHERRNSQLSVVPQHLKILLLKHQTQAINDRIPAKGCRHHLVNPWATGTGKGHTCQL